MAFYIVILKVRETPEKVFYSFGPKETKMGMLEFNKNDGTVTEREPAPTDNPSALFIRAAVKIRQHWKKGELPEETEWAS